MWLETKLDLDAFFPREEAFYKITAVVIVLSSEWTNLNFTWINCVQWMIYALVHAFKCPYKLYGAKNRVICCQWCFVVHSAKVFACRSCYRNILIIGGVDETNSFQMFPFLRVQKYTRVHTQTHIQNHHYLDKRALVLHATGTIPSQQNENNKCRCSTRLEVWRRYTC